MIMSEFYVITVSIKFDSFFANITTWHGSWLCMDVITAMVIRVTRVVESLSREYRNVLEFLELLELL